MACNCGGCPALSKVCVRVLGLLLALPLPFPKFSLLPLPCRFLWWSLLMVNPSTLQESSPRSTPCTSDGVLKVSIAALFLGRIYTAGGLYGLSLRARASSECLFRLPPNTIKFLSPLLVLLYCCWNRTAFPVFCCGVLGFSVFDGV